MAKTKNTNTDMTAPYFKVRWNHAVGFVQASKIVQEEERQEILKLKNQTTYCKYVTVGADTARFAQVVQLNSPEGLEIMLLVSSKTQQPHAWMFHLDNLPSMGEWDTIEFKQLDDKVVRGMMDHQWDDMLPCPQEYIDAIASQDDKWIAPEGW